MEKNHNKEALILVDTKKSEVLLEQQAIGTGFIPSHRFNANFLNPSSRLKENPEADEYIKLLITPCLNEEVEEGFIFSCYTGLRFVDAKWPQWEHIKENQLPVD